MKSTENFSIVSNGYSVDVELNIMVVHTNVLQFNIRTMTDGRMIGSHSTHYNMNDNSISFFSQLSNEIKHLRLTKFMTKEEIEKSLGKIIEDTSAEKEAYNVHNLIVKHFTLECSSIQQTLESMTIPVIGDIQGSDFKLIQDLLGHRLQGLLKTIQ